MPPRRRLAKRRRTELDVVEWMELQIGPSRHGSAFPDDETRRAVWALHRDELAADRDGDACWATRRYAPKG